MITWLSLADGVRLDGFDGWASAPWFGRDEVRLNWNGVGNSPLPSGEVGAPGSAFHAVRAQAPRRVRGYGLSVRAAPPHPICSGRCFASPGANRPLPAGERWTEYADGLIQLRTISL